MLNLKNDEDKPQNQRAWVREEMVLLVAEYFRTKNLDIREKKKSIQSISKILRNRALVNGEDVSEIYRNENGIQMQLACIIKYDPDRICSGERGGLSGGGKLMRQVVEDYVANPYSIKAEAYDVIMKYYQNC